MLPLRSHQVTKKMIHLELMQLGRPLKSLIDRAISALWELAELHVDITSLVRSLERLKGDTEPVELNERVPYTGRLQTL